MTIVDNPETPVADNPETPAAPAAPETPAAAPEAFSWKTRMNTDVQNSPFLQKFDDTEAGFNKFGESYGNLEKLIGHEKVPIPKGDDDVEGWSRFSKAMGIPDKAEGYGLPDANIPESMQEMTLNKQQFAEVAHAHKLTPAQTKGLWQTYTGMSIEAYGNAMKTHETTMVNTVNQLKSEWGDAYQGNVELGQTVISKFAGDADTNDFITSALSKDPKGVKFLAKIGEQFAENKIGGAEFQMRRFTKAPEEAAEEVQKIMADSSHPYKNPGATDKEHKAAVDYVNSLLAIANRGKG